MTLQVTRRAQGMYEAKDPNGSTILMRRMNDGSWAAFRGSDCLLSDEGSFKALREKMVTVLASVKKITNDEARAQKSASQKTRRSRESTMKVDGMTVIVNHTTVQTPGALPNYMALTAESIAKNDWLEMWGASMFDGHMSMPGFGSCRVTYSLGGPWKSREEMMKALPAAVAKAKAEKAASDAKASKMRIKL